MNECEKCELKKAALLVLRIAKVWIADGCKNNMEQLADVLAELAPYEKIITKEKR